MRLQADGPTGKARRRTPKIAPLIAITIVFAIIPLYHPSLRYYYSTNKLSSSDDQELTLALPDDGDNGDTITQENFHVKIDVDEEKHDSNIRRDSTRQKLHRENGDTAHRKNGGDEMELRNNIINGDEEECDLFRGEWVENHEGPYYTNKTCYAIQEHQNCMKFGRPDTGFLKWKWKPNGRCDLPVFDPSEFLEYMRGKSLAFVGDSVARNHMQSLICLLSRVCVLILSLFLFLSF